MKNIKILFLTLLVSTTITTFESCKKYPDGPLISFHSRTERVANTWKIDNYKKNGTDYTSLLSDYTETYTKNGNYSYSFGMLSGAGLWAFQNNDKEIKLTGTTNQDSHTMVILKLEEKQFWYYYMDGTDKKEFHMIPQ
jgi:hypothetical protein